MNSILYFIQFSNAPRPVHEQYLLNPNQDLEYFVLLLGISLFANKYYNSRLFYPFCLGSSIRLFLLDRIDHYA